MHEDSRGGEDTVPGSLFARPDYVDVRPLRCDHSATQPAPQAIPVLRMPRDPRCANVMTPIAKGTVLYRHSYSKDFHARAVA